jgi:hypothetical protein
MADADGMAFDATPKGLGRTDADFGWIAPASHYTCRFEIGVLYFGRGSAILKKQCPITAKGIFWQISESL